MERGVEVQQVRVALLAGLLQAVGAHAVGITGHRDNAQPQLPGGQQQAGVGEGVAENGIARAGVSAEDGKDGRLRTRAEGKAAAVQVTQCRFQPTLCRLQQ
ncbi:hypothetical protein D3C80_1191970 [compost metagenome]